MPVGTTAVQAMAVGAFTGEQSPLNTTGGGGGDCAHRTANSAPTSPLASKGWRERTDRRRTRIGAGRLYTHVTTAIPNMALRFGIGGGDLSGGVAYLTADAAAEFSRFFTQGFGGYFSIDAAASGLLRDRAYVKAAGYSAPMELGSCRMWGPLAD